MIEAVELAVRRVLKKVGDTRPHRGDMSEIMFLMLANELEDISDLELEYVDCGKENCPAHGLSNELIMLRGRQRQ